jgi:hypothetical protein
MNLTRTYYAMCRRYPGGITAVAHLLGMGVDTLQKKLSPTCDTHHLNVDEAEAIDLLLTDKAGAIEHARLNGLACIPLPTFSEEGSIARGMSDIAREFGDVLRAFDEMMKDNRVTPNECEGVQRQILELHGECLANLARARALAASRAPVFSIRESAA